jgi:hypothetical protein
MQTPGIGTEIEAQPRQIFASLMNSMVLPSGRIIEGAYSRDPRNTGDVTTLRGGMILGRRTNSGKYAPSIIGPITVAAVGADTTLTVSAATGVELDRRIGAGGVFKLVGPTTDGGANVRERKLSYSVNTAGVITLAANSAVAEVQLCTLSAVATAGTFRLGYKGQWTTALAYNATTAEIQAALDALPNVGVSGITPEAAHEPDTTDHCSYTFATTLGDIAMMDMDITSLTGPVTAVFTQTTAGELVAYATPGTTCVQTCTNTGLVAGVVRIRLTSPLTGYQYLTAELANNASCADIETAITNAVGVNCVAVGGTDIDAFTLTFTDGDTTWANMPVPLVQIVPGTAYTVTIGPTVVMTTPGVAGTFPIGSLIMPADGSSVPLGILGSEYGTKVVDAALNNIDVACEKLIVGGFINQDMIVDYPTVGDLRDWLKLQLKASGKFLFMEDF